MTKKILDYLIVALCGACSLYLKSKYSPSDSSPAAFVLPVLGAAGLFFVLTVVINLPKKLERLRKWLRLTDEAPLEGYWIENEILKDGERYYSLFEISYDSEADKYRVSGTAHSVDGQIHADWDSIVVKFDKTTMQLYYVYLGNVLHVTRKAQIHGYAWLNFFNAHPIEKGSGFFVDCHENPRRFDIQLERINPDLIKQLIERKRLEVRHRSDFIKRYHAWIHVSAPVLEKSKGAPE